MLKYEYDVTEYKIFSSSSSLLCIRNHLVLIEIIFHYGNIRRLDTGYGEPKKLYFHAHNFGVSSKIHCLEQ